MRKQAFIIALLAGLYLAVAFLAARLPTADFYENFYGAARHVLAGETPYESTGYIVAPWGVIPLLPFALLPPLPAHGLYFATCLFVLAYIAWRLQAGPLAIAAFFLSPTTIGALLVGNLDPIVMAGILFAPSLGLLVLLMKPQIGTGVALYYLAGFIREKRFLEGLKVFAPTIIAYALAALLFPIWYVRMFHNPANVWNRSLFPYALPLGFLFLWLAIRHRNPYFALASTPFLAPYLSFYTYLAVQLGLLHSDVEKFVRRDILQVCLSVSLWAIMLIFRL